MLEKHYTIPVLFGICLGLILTGVQISTSALNVALGQQKIAPLIIEKVDRDELKIRLLGKEVLLDVPDSAQKMAVVTGAWAENAYTGWIKRTSDMQGRLTAYMKQGKESFNSGYETLKKIKEYIQGMKAGQSINQI